jgi:hypothetical protein
MQPWIIAITAVIAANERVIFSITDRVYWETPP